MNVGGSERERTTDSAIQWLEEHNILKNEEERKLLLNHIIK